MTWVSAGDLARQALAEAEIRTEHPDLVGLSTGVTSIDDRLRPILEPGRLITVAAESGSGKTAFAAQLAVAFAHQVPVLWLSLEDDGVDVLRRALANVARAPVSGLRAGFRSGTVPASVHAAVERIDALPLDVMDACGDVISIGMEARNWARTRDVSGPLGGVLIVDQLSHIAPTSAAMSEFLERSGLPTPPTRGAADHQVLEWQVSVLREVGRRLNLLTVLFHQLNDSRGDDGKPTMASVRGSRGIVHKADALIVPWRPKRVDNPFAGPGEPPTLEAEPDAAELLCLKGRSIASGWSLPLRWDGSHQRLADRDEPEAADAIYEAPDAPTPQALEGARRLAECRALFAAQRVAQIEAAAVAELTARVELTEAESDDLR
jgi:replicative DNA helicase